MQTAPPADQVEKVRKRYRKKKSQLEEAFPSYLQVHHVTLQNAHTRTHTGARTYTGHMPTCSQCAATRGGVGLDKVKLHLDTLSGTFRNMWH